MYSNKTRRFFKVIAFLTIFATAFIMISVVAIYYESVGIDTGLKWSYILPFLILNGLVVMIGGVGMNLIATNDLVWKEIREIEKVQEALLNEQKEIERLKEKLVEKLLMKP